MCHSSPAAFMVWATLSCLLGSFLLFHLWSFDRFKCLKWNHGPYSGAFKRVMTYSYMTSVPLIMAYALGFAIIKYQEGFTQMPFVGVIPTPYQLWSQKNQSAIFPLYLMFSIAWSLEMVTHLEELCFWLFLVNAGSAQQDWFRSLYFKTWTIGSVIAVICMPLVTIFTRGDPLKCEAYTFLAGSLGSLSLTIWFTPILWTFPSFLKNLKRENVDAQTVIRLTKFHELNTIRIIFRFVFVCPLLILAVDGVRTHQHVNGSMVWTDLLAMLSALGCVISSAITLVIFFPRSVEGEIAARDAAREKRRNASMGVGSMLETQHSQHGGGTYLLTSSPVMRASSLPSQDEYDTPAVSPISRTPLRKPSTVLDRDTLPMKEIPMRPNRRPDELLDLEVGRKVSVYGLTEANMSSHNIRQSGLNPMVHNFTSPINVMYTPAESPSIPKLVPRYTFSRP